MDAATQKLVDEARRAQAAVYLATDKAVADDLSRIIAGLADALEAAQRPPLNPLHESVCRCGATGNGECVRPPVSPEVREAVLHVVLGYNPAELSPAGRRMFAIDIKRGERTTDALLARFSLPSQPEVSPELREEIARTVMGALGCEMQDDTCDCEYPCAHKPYSYCKTHDDLDVVDTGAPCLKALAVADALLARFSVPSQPVYDEEKIARLVAAHEADVDQSAVYEGGCSCGWSEPKGWDRYGHTSTFHTHVAAALVAALRGGELTREETNE